MDAERLTAAMNNSDQLENSRRSAGLKNVLQKLWRSGQYSIGVSRNGIVYITPRSGRSRLSVHFLAKIQWSDTGILLLAVVFSSLLSFLAIEKSTPLEDLQIRAGPSRRIRLMPHLGVGAVAHDSKQDPARNCLAPAPGRHPSEPAPSRP